MPIRRIVNLPLACLLIIVIIASSAGASSYVWCISADGDHAALEFAPSGDCSQDNCARTTGSGATVAFDPAAAGCGPCLDIASTHQWNVSRSRLGDLTVEVPAGIALPATDSCAPLPERVLATQRLVDPPPRIPDPILHHRTIVLLI